MSEGIKLVVSWNTTHLKVEIQFKFQKSEKNYQNHFSESLPPDKN